jgi:fructokinase
MDQENDLYTIIGLGEIVWDLLPAGPQLGGAPANFAYYANLLGNHGIIAGRVGADAPGPHALHHLEELGLTTAHIQIDEVHPTGTVLVQVDERGQPDFTITEDVAWDFMEWTSEWQELAFKADAICFGSVAQRSRISRETIRSFLRATRKDALRVFDLNLRQSFYSEEVIDESLRLSQVVKLNDQEALEITAMLGLGGSNDEERARALLHAYNVALVCVTRGAQGSLIVTDTEVVEHPGVPITIADAVGAGDAFTATLTHHYLRGAPLKRISQAANHLGAWIASQVGATPVIEQSVLKRITGGRETS